MLSANGARARGLRTRGQSATTYETQEFTHSSIWLRPLISKIFLIFIAALSADAPVCTQKGKQLSAKSCPREVALVSAATAYPVPSQYIETNFSSYVRPIHTADVLVKNKKSLIKVRRTTG